MIGRVVANGIGGGIKHKYHWVKWLRDGPTEGPPKEEKVIEVIFRLINELILVFNQLLTIMKNVGFERWLQIS